MRSFTAPRNSGNFVAYQLSRFSNFVKLSSVRGNRLSAMVLLDADTLLTQITLDNPLEPYETQQNNQRGGSLVLLFRIMSRSKEVRIPRLL